jgi:hypothetical protein
MAPLKLKSVSAGEGVRWVRQGFATLARRPMPFVGLVSTFYFAMVLMLALRPPLPLMLLWASALPIISLGFMNATRLVADTQTSTLAAFLAPLRPGRPVGRALLLLTLAYFVTNVIIALISSVAYGDSLGALVEAETSEAPSTSVIAERVADPRLAVGILVQVGLATLFSVPFWHAPALVYWGGQGVAQSLFSSTIACWRNRGAFLLYGLAFLVVVFGFLVVAAILHALLGGGRVAAMLSVSIAFIIPTAFYASLYFTFRGCFESADTASPPAPDGASTPPPP